jgi:hypothetical protein
MRHRPAAVQQQVVLAFDGRRIAGYVSALQEGE